VKLLDETAQAEDACAATIPTDLKRLDPVTLMATLVRCQNQVEQWSRIGLAVVSELAVRWPDVLAEIKRRARV